MMKKEIKKYGDSFVVSFTKEDIRLWNMKEGDVAYVKLDKEIDWDELNRRVDDEVKKDYFKSERKKQ